MRFFYISFGQGDMSDKTAVMGATFWGDLKQKIKKVKIK